MTPDQKQLELNLTWLYVNDPARYMMALENLALKDSPIRNKVEKQ